MNGRCVAIEEHPAESPLTRLEILRQSLLLAVKSHDGGQLQEAEQLYRAILTVDPLHADALHGLGVIAHQTGFLDLAAQFISQAIVQRSDPTFHSNLALVLLESGRPHEALASVYSALELRPAYPQAYNALGNVQQKLGCRDEAIASYRLALHYREDYLDALVNLGKVLMERGDLDDAASAYEKALALNPNSADAHNNLGNLLRLQGKPDEALAAFEKALALNPIHAEAHNNRGVALATLKKTDEAIAAFRCAIAIKPAFETALNGCGAMLSAQGKLQEAIDCYRRSLEINPNSVEALNNLGAAYMQLQRMDEAMACFEQAIEIADGKVASHSWFNMGNLLLKQNETDRAIESYEKAVALNPALSAARNNLGCALQSKGNVAEAVEAFGEALAYQPDYGDAFSNRILMMHYLESISNAELLEAACDFGRRYDRPDTTPFAGRDLSADRKLRIGYVSGDFCLHPVAFFLARVLAAHHRDAFEIFAYSNCAAEDAATAHIRSLSNAWRPIHALSDAEAAALIRADAIDILVDLAGHTARNRLSLFGLRPAPVQVSWLGYWSTTGMATMDYLVFDPVSAPKGADQWYREAIVRLPESRFCYRQPFWDILPGDPPSRVRGYITFGSFNNVAKITASVLLLWAEILRAVPNSRLLLKWKTLCEPGTRQRIFDQFAEQGVSPDRIEMRGATPFEAMLSEYHDVDIALDTFPFGGGTTSCEALWMGVPIVTLPGERLSSRQTLGFLTLMGFADLAAATPEDYKAIAVSLAGDPSRLLALRHRLRPAFEASPICDGSRFTSRLEAAFREMWKRYVAGEKPAPFDIAPGE